MAIEDELESCETCAGMGMKDQAVCPDCRGRGIVRVSHAVVELPEDDDAEEEPKPLENLSKAQLVELAESLGLSKSGNRTELIERIQAGPLAPPDAEGADVSDDPTAEPGVDPEANAADATPEEVAAAAATDDGLDDLTVAQLRERLKDAGQDSTGKRDELLERLRA